MRLGRSVMIVVVIASVLAMSSCVKKYTCQCVVKYSGAPGLPDSTVKEYEVRDTKKAAESVCKDASFEHIENGIKVVETCKLY